MDPNRSTRQKIVRTPEGIQYEVETNEPYEVSAGDIGELVRTDQRLSDSVSRVAISVVDGLRKVAAMQADLNYDSRVASVIEHANVRFGISLSGAGAFFVTEGQSDAHVIVELTITSRIRDEQGRDVGP
jgi:hypothetical protein